MEINEILKINFINDLIQRTCGEDIELIRRPESFMVRSAHEGEQDMHRLILLPPKGYTADKINQMNSHDEAEYATIEIKGAVREEKSGFSILRECLLVASLPKSEATSDLNKPYMTFTIDGGDNPDLQLKRHSAGTAPFSVVKSDGYGFYHNLINLTDEWLILQLYKKLRLQKTVDLNPHLSSLLKGQAQSLQALYDGVVKYGDALFQKMPKLVESITHMPVQHTLPALAEMLFTHDTGKHEACTVFAVILKIGKMHPMHVTEFLNTAIIEKTIPAYYAQQLLVKINTPRTERKLYSASN